MLQEAKKDTTYLFNEETETNLSRLELIFKMPAYLWSRLLSRSMKIMAERDSRNVSNQFLLSILQAAYFKM